MKPICILGEGAWGTAVATVLANNGYTVNLWCHDKEVAQNIEKNRINDRYLPDITLNDAIIPCTDLAQAINGAEYIFEAIPVIYLRSIVQQAKQYYKPEQTWVILSKGIEQNTCMLPSNIVDDVFQQDVNKVILAGPSFAYDLARKQLTAVVLASHHKQLAKNVQKLLANDYFCTTFSSDVIGVQIGGALKNIITLGIGILDGAGYTDNTKALVLMCGLQEMVCIAQQLGGQKESIYGLSGVGDLVLSAYGQSSKNRAIGRCIGGGESLQTIVQNGGLLPEGINTVQAIQQLAQKNNLDLPLCMGIYQVIFESKKIDLMLRELMSCLKSEKNY